MSDSEDKIKEVELEQEERLAMQIAKVNNLTYLSAHGATTVVPIINKEEAKNAGAVVIKEDEANLYIAVRNPKDKNTQNSIEELKKQYEHIEVFVISETTLNQLIESYPEKHEGGGEALTEKVYISDSDLAKFAKVDITMHEVEDVLKNISKTDISKALEVLLSNTINMGTTDIHIEPQEKTTVVRIKIDGLLHEVATIEEHMYKLMLSRIKLLSDLKLNIHDQAQEGNFSVAFKNRDIEIRTSILPSEYGEDIALRVLDPKSILSLEELGMRRDLFNILKKYLTYPQGLILVTGPTGSGKTTTLYACINFVKQEGTKIITIEDPIEYRLEGITQTEVNEDEDYTFASGLKAILRQDPDTLLISELRDIGSAEPALQATLAGRKVFSTLHTIDAAGTAPRLIDMGADPSTVSSALSLSMSQRLVRRLCENCKKLQKITDEEYTAMSNMLKEIPKNIPGATLSKDSKLGVPKKEGCVHCKGTGYKNRIAVFELFSASKKVRERIMGNPTEDEMRTIMKEQNETNMLQDAVIKILDGTTSTDEVKRVFGEFL